MGEFYEIPTFKIELPEKIVKKLSLKKAFYLILTTQKLTRKFWCKRGQLAWNILFKKS